LDLPASISTVLHELRTLTGVPMADLVRAGVELLQELAIAEETGGRVVRQDGSHRPVTEIRLPRKGLARVPIRSPC
jgi:hypothetical protein